MGIGRVGQNNFDFPPLLPSFPIVPKGLRLRRAPKMPKTVGAPLRARLLGSSSLRIQARSAGEGIPSACPRKGRVDVSSEAKRNETKRSQASKPGVFCETKPSLKSSGRPNEHRKPMRAAVAKRSQASPFPIGSKGFRVKWVGYFGPLRCELNRRHGSRVPDPSHPVFADRIGKCSLTDRLARAGLVTLGKHQGGQRLAALGLDQQKGFRPLGRYGDSCDGGPRRGFQRRSGRGPLRSARERRPRR